MPEIDHRKWAPGHMVVEVLSTRPTAPWKPTAPTWATIELIATIAISRASMSSRLAAGNYYLGGTDNG